MQISFLHDVHRAEWDGGTAERSSRWLHALIAPALRRLGHQTTRIGLAHPTIQSLLGQTLSTHNSVSGSTLRWPTLFSDPSAIPQLTSILPLLSQAALVIGFELSPNLMRLLHTAGIPFTDIAIDPIRFAPDLFLAVRTNDPSLAQAFAYRAVPIPTITRQACLLAPPILIKNPPARPFTSKALFTGQTDIDAGLIVGARLGTIHSHIPALRARYGTGDHLLLKPHPYGRTNRDILALHQAFPNARLVNDNTYSLLTSGAVTEVVTLSSGTATEAPFFGVPGITLIDPDIAQSGPASARFRLPLDVFSPDLWASVTRSPGRPRPVSLRARLGLAWAYPPPATLPTRHLKFGKHANADLRAFGWSHMEPTGCWTDGPLATLLIDSVPELVNLTLHCRPHLPMGASSLYVRVELRGTPGPQQHLVFHTSHPRRLTITLPLSNGPVEIALHILNPRRPTASTSNDQRALGLHLTAIHVRSARSAVPDRYHLSIPGLLPAWLSDAARAVAASIAAVFIGG